MAHYKEEEEFKDQADRNQTLYPSQSNRDLDSDWVIPTDSPKKGRPPVPPRPAGLGFGSPDDNRGPLLGNSGYQLGSNGELGDQQIESLDDINAIGRVLYSRIRKNSNYSAIVANVIFSAIVGVGTCAPDLDPNNHFDNNSTKSLVFSEISLVAFFILYTYTASEVFKSFLPALPESLADIINENHRRDKILSRVRTLGVASVAAALTALSIAASNEPTWVRALMITHAIQNYYVLDQILLESKALMKRMKCSQYGRNIQKAEDAFDHVLHQMTYKNSAAHSIPPALTPFSQNNDKALLHELAEEVVRLDIQAEQPMSLPRLIFTRVLPSILATGLSTGLITNSIQQLVNPSKDKVDLPLLNTLPLLFPVLAIKWTADSFMNLADVLSGRGEKPLAYHLHPFITVIASLVAGGVTVAGFSTVVDMIRNEPIFKSGDPTSDTQKHMLILAAFTAFVFVNHGNQKSVFNLIPAFTRLWGSENKKEIANFVANMEEFRDDVKHRVSPAKFIESFKKLDQTDRIRLLPMVNPGDNVETLLDNLETQPINNPYGEGYGSIAVDDSSTSKFSQFMETVKGYMPSFSTASFSFLPFRRESIADGEFENIEGQSNSNRSINSPQ